MHYLMVYCYLIKKSSWVLFKEGVHYINYNDKNDLLDKIQYYQKNYNTDGIKIANNGFNLVKNELNSHKVWENIFKNLMVIKFL